MALKIRRAQVGWSGLCVQEASAGASGAGAAVRRRVALLAVEPRLLVVLSRGAVPDPARCTRGRGGVLISPGGR